MLVMRKNLSFPLESESKNKFLFGHDLRLNTKESAPIKLEHNSCLNDILFDNVNLNQLYTSDLTGQVTVNKNLSKLLKNIYS